MTHHVKTIYLGDESGHFLAIGDDRSKENPGFCHIFASDEQGRRWKWLNPKGLKRTGPKGEFVSNGKVVVLTDRGGANAFRSLDGGEIWDGPHVTGTQRATLSVVKGEFWLASDSGSLKSVDGRKWHDLPEITPAGKIAASKKGTLISIDRKRFNILRSTDDGETWNEVYSFKPETEHVHGAQGLRDIVFGYTTAQPRTPLKEQE